MRVKHFEWTYFGIEIDEIDEEELKMATEGGKFNSFGWAHHGQICKLVGWLNTDTNYERIMNACGSRTVVHILLKSTEIILDFKPSD